MFQVGDRVEFTDSFKKSIQDIDDWDVHFASSHGTIKSICATKGYVDILWDTEKSSWPVSVNVIQMVNEGSK